MQEVNHFHSKDINIIFREFQTTKNGLSKQEAETRLSKNGLNEISKKRKTPLILKFLGQLNSPLIYILIVAMTISFIFHHRVDGYVILAVILINATIGFAQERKAEKAIDALKKLIVSYAKVYRNGEIIKIPSKNLVPGDVFVLEEGDKVPADARLIEIKNFKTQESSLTGESFPQEKNLKVLSSSVSLGDRTNMVFMSTLVVSGEAKAVVVATANQTQIGQVAKSIQEIAHPKLHFNEKVRQLAIQMAIFASIGALLTFLIGFFINRLEFIEIFLFTIASLVSGIPEGLPAILVIVLAIGAQRMAKRNAVIRHLPAVETLGVATVIATDKTGTLTQNSITVEKILTADKEFTITGEGWQPLGKFFEGKTPIHPLKNPTLRKILGISTLCNKGGLAKKGKDYEVVGDPTEVSLLVLGKKAGFDKQKMEKKIVDDFPFSSELKFRATLINEKGKKRLCAVGAFEKILSKSRYVIKANRKNRLDENIKNDFLKKAESLAKKGMRVLAIGYKEVTPNFNSISKESVEDLVFLGLVGMKDPPRKKIKESVQKAKNAGIRVIMKTGDHKETAIAIAKEIGLVGRNAKALTQTDLEKMDKVQFREAIKKVDIYARVTPKMKMRIIKELQEQGEIVAMTGDGVNDAPALKKADIGISMGIIGTDVARESSAIVLADDNFSSIVNAIEEGRIVFQNVRQTSFFLITTSVAEDVTIVSSLAMGLALPLLPIQLLFLNLVTDTLPGIGLSMEPGHHDVLNKPPRNKKERILNKEVIPFLIFMALLMAIGTIPIFRHFLPQGINKARTIAFATLAMFQLFNVLNMRSLKKSLFKVGITSNKWLVLGIMTSFLLMLGVIFLPGISDVFRFVPLTIKELLLVTLVASSVFIAGELYKLVIHRPKKTNLD